MTRTIHNLEDLERVLDDYMRDERPLNLREIRDALDVVRCVRAQGVSVCRWAARELESGRRMDGLVQVHLSALKRNLGGLH